MLSKAVYSFVARFILIFFKLRRFEFVKVESEDGVQETRNFINRVYLESGIYRDIPPVSYESEEVQDYFNDKYDAILAVFNCYRNGLLLGSIAISEDQSCSTFSEDLFQIEVPLKFASKHGLEINRLAIDRRFRGQSSSILMGLMAKVYLLSMKKGMSYFLCICNEKLQDTIGLFYDNLNVLATKETPIDHPAIAVYNQRFTKGRIESRRVLFIPLKGVNAWKALNSFVKKPAKHKKSRR